MATNDIGRVTPIWRGFYSAATTYELNDIVIDTAGSVWWHKSEELTTGVIPEAGEIWSAVIDMSVFSALIQAAITTAQTAVQAAQEAESEVAEDVRRAETAAQSAEASAEAASESAAGVGALAQAAEQSKTEAQTAATQAAASASSAGASATSAGSSAQTAEAAKTAAQTAATQAAGSAETASGAAAVVEQKKTEALAAIQAKGEEVLESIPEDYTELSGDVGDLKTRLNTNQNEGLYTSDVVWEHGGISNSTGENVEDGSLTRTRTPDYYKCEDYNKIFNDSLLYLYVIFYNSDYSLGFVTNTRNNTAAPVRKEYAYFRLDLRASMDNVSHVFVYKDSGYISAAKKALENVYVQSLNDIMFEQGHIDNTTGKDTYMTAYVRTGFIATNPNTEINILNKNTTYRMTILQYGIDKSFISALIAGMSTESAKVTTGANTYYLRVEIYKAGYGNITPSDIKNAAFFFKYGMTSDEIKEEVYNSKIEENVYSVQSSRHIPSDAANPLTLLHFSDLHQDTGSLARIINKSNDYGILINDIICTGDMVSNVYEQISSWWDERVLTCIGNHDTASYSVEEGYNWTALSMANRDAYYIAPFESNWGITHTSGTSYYYKDYATQKVRLIVMDVMLYMSNTTSSEASAQTSWLSGLLSDAITNNLHVIIAIHAPHGGATAEECSFSKYNQGTMPTDADCNTPQTVIDTVASAITGGLKFIGYIVGHRHQDNMLDAENDGKQLMYCVTCAAVAQKAQWTKSDQHRSVTADAFNIITIDTANTLVKIIRGGGANMDDKMRTRKAICFNYTTGEKVGEIL